MWNSLMQLTAVIQEVKTIGIVLYTIVAVLMICTILVKYLVARKIDFVTIVLIGALVFNALLKPTDKTLFYILLSLLFVCVALLNLNTVYSYICNETRRLKVEEHIKNDTADFFICMDKHNKVTSYSASFVKLTKLTKKQICKKNGWKLLFEELPIRKINNEEFITSNANIFIDHLDEVLSKYKMYEFTLDIRNQYDDESTHYLGYIQAIYLKDKKIGTAVYLYNDKQSLITEIKSKLDNTLYNLYNHKNVLHILMSLSEGVALYYDYQERLFFATQSFMDFTETDKQTYTFREFYDMIADVDKDRYNEQSAVISSVSATRIKFKFRVKNTYFNAIEDSIYLTRDGEEYISIVHITSRADEATNDKILSTKESSDLLDSLSEMPVAPAVYKIEQLLNNSLKEDIDEE